NVPDEMKSTLQSISEQSRELVGKLGEVVWSAKPKHDDLDSMLAYFRSYIHHFMSGLNFHYEIFFPEKIINVSINTELRRNLFLIMKEALNNSVKHSSASRIEIIFLQNQKRYELHVIDDGKGMNGVEEKSFSGGNGLTNMRSRAEAIHSIV